MMDQPALGTVSIVILIATSLLGYPTKSEKDLMMDQPTLGTVCVVIYFVSHF